MRNWKFEINVYELHNKARKDEILAFEYAKGMAATLKNFRRRVAALLEIEWEGKETFVEGWDDIIDAFAEVSENEAATFDDTDKVLEDLYDFADYHRIWINANTPYKSPLERVGAGG